MLYEAWAVSATYTGITKPAMSAAFSFPLSLYLPALLRWRNVQRCERCGIDTPKRAERAARSCLAALEARLAGPTASAAAGGSAVGDPYFFGSEPSALDATVYAYIETIYRSPYNGCVSSAPHCATGWRLRSPPLPVPDLQRGATVAGGGPGPAARPQGALAPVPAPAGAPRAHH